MLTVTGGFNYCPVFKNLAAVVSCACVFRKQILDDDKRKLRLYQERYLADGDLHSDGPGRERRFRWKNMGEYKCIYSGTEGLKIDFDLILKLVEIFLFILFIF